MSPAATLHASPRASRLVTTKLTGNASASSTTNGPKWSGNTNGAARDATDHANHNANTPKGPASPLPLKPAPPSSRGPGGKSASPAQPAWGNKNAASNTITNVKPSATVQNDFPTTTETKGACIIIVDGRPWSSCQIFGACRSATEGGSCRGREERVCRCIQRPSPRSKGSSLG